MRRFSFLGFWFVLLLILGSVSVCAAAFALGDNFSLIVKHHDSHSSDRKWTRVLYRQLGVKTVRTYRGPMWGFEQLSFSTAHLAQSALQKLEQDLRIHYVQWDLPIGLPQVDPTQGAPSDWTFPVLPCLPGTRFPPRCRAEDGHSHPVSSRRPALESFFPLTSRTGPDPGMADGAVFRLMDRPGAEELAGLNLLPVVVAVHDTGVDYNHEDLRTRLWRNPTSGKHAGEIGRDYIHRDSLPYDEYNHGTAVAGIIGAVEGNSFGVAGVAPHAQIMTIKIFNPSGGSRTSDAISGVSYAILHGARVLNLSWGFESISEDRAFRDALMRAHRWGLLCVAGAGNKQSDSDGELKFWPSSSAIPNMISVAATDREDRLASFSNYGRSSVHLAALGEDVEVLDPQNHYRMRSGTSFAAPFVSGAAALIWGMHPHWTHLEVRDAILRSVDQIPGLANRVSTGGRLNIRRAMGISQAPKAERGNGHP